MAELRIKAQGHMLSFINLPVLASGSIDSDSIKVDFDEAWDSLVKIAIFYQNKGEYSYSVMDGSTAKVPNGVLEASNPVYVGIAGIDASGNQVLTSSLLRYEVKEGSYVEIDDPDKDVYKQILAQLNRAADINDIEANGTQTYSSNKIETIIKEKLPNTIKLDSSRNVQILDRNGGILATVARQEIWPLESNCGVESATTYASIKAVHDLLVYLEERVNGALTCTSVTASDQIRGDIVLDGKTITAYYDVGNGKQAVQLDGTDLLKLYQLIH